MVLSLVEPRGIRTPDLLNAIQALSQLSYGPRPVRQAYSHPLDPYQGQATQEGRESRGNTPNSLMRILQRRFLRTAGDRPVRPLPARLAPSKKRVLRGASLAASAFYCDTTDVAQSAVSGGKADCFGQTGRGVWRQRAELQCVPRSPRRVSRMCFWA